MLTRMANIDLISGRRTEAPKTFVGGFVEAKVMEANFKFKFVNFHLTSRREGSMDFHALAFASNRKETSEPFNGEEKKSHFPNSLFALSNQLKDHNYFLCSLKEKFLVRVQLIDRATDSDC